MNPSKTLLAVVWIAVACIAGWVWYSSTSSASTSSESTGGSTGKAPSSPDGKPMQGDPALSSGDGNSQAGSNDPEWSKFSRQDVVVPAISTIPRLFHARDVYRDEVLNPRDTYIPPSHRKHLKALVDSFMPRIREADRQALVAKREAAKMPRPVNAAKSTITNAAQSTVNRSRQEEYLDAVASAQASGRSAHELIAQEVRGPDAAPKPPSTTGNAGQAPITAQPMPNEPDRFRKLSISLRTQLLERITKLMSGIGVLSRLEANAITISTSRKLQLLLPK